MHHGGTENTEKAFSRQTPPQAGNPLATLPVLTSLAALIDDSVAMLRTLTLTLYPEGEEQEARGSDLKHFSCLIVLEGKWMGR